MSGVRRLEEVEHVVDKFEETHGEGWSAWKVLKAEVESIGRSEEGEEEKDWRGNYTTATAKVHLVVKDKVVIGSGRFIVVRTCGR